MPTFPSPRSASGWLTENSDGSWYERPFYEVMSVPQHITFDDSRRVGQPDVVLSQPRRTQLESSEPNWISVNRAGKRHQVLPEST
jgi:hypothetical protein